MAGTVPANITTDIQNLADALAVVQQDQVAVAAATAALGGDQTALNAANTQMTTDQNTAAGLYQTLLTDLAAWDAGTTPAAQAFKTKLKALAVKKGPKGSFDWAALVQTLVTDLLPALLQLISGLSPAPTTP